MTKLTKAQRRKLLTPELRDLLSSLSDDVLLAAHDFMHEQMEERYGTNRRSEISDVPSNP